MYRDTLDTIVDSIENLATCKCNAYETHENNGPKLMDNHHQQKSNQDSRIQMPFDIFHNYHHSQSISKLLRQSSLFFTDKSQFKFILPNYILV